MNTQFQKPDEKLATYAEMGVRGAPYNRDRHEMLDYILTNSRGRNSMKDKESDVEHGVETRHMPVIANARFHMSLARQYTERKEPPKRYAQFTHTDKEIYNTTLQRRLEGKTNRKEIIETIAETATKLIPQTSQ